MKFTDGKIAQIQGPNSWVELKVVRLMKTVKNLLFTVVLQESVLYFFHVGGRVNPAKDGQSRNVL